jgi:Zn-dependent protease
MFGDLGLSNPVLNVAFLLLCVLVSMTVHEFMHAYVGFKLGDTTAMEHGRVSFNPLHHIDPFTTVLLPVITLWLFHFPILAAKPVPFDPRRVKYHEYGAALLAVAGPASNLVLAFVAALVLRFFDPSQAYQDVMSFFVELNVVLAVFNMVPIPPLDGSRVLYAFAPEPVQDFMRQIEPYGFMVIIVLVLWGGAANVLMNIDNFVLSLLP